jgi:glyoxylase-like metal-dependent hydrolase (beta-lactamase superfamily II)
MKRGVIGTLVLAGLFGTTPAGRAQSVRELRMQSLAVNDELYLLSGGGGRSLVLVAGPGVVLVDAKAPGWSGSVLEIIRGVTDKPLTTVINTHGHEDHAGATAEYPSGVEVIVHELAKPHLKSKAPVRAFQERLSLLDGIDRIELYYFGPAHTDSDIVVVFPGKRVAHVGDLFPSKSAPVIDSARGGSGVAYPETLAKAVAALTGVSRVITGHGPAVSGSPVLSGLATLRDLQEYADFNRDFLAAVRAAKEAGKTADEAAASLQLPERYKAYDMTNAAANVKVIYGELQ